MIHGSRMTLTSDCNEEFFDARSDIGCPPDDLLSDGDSDDGDDYVPSVATPEPLNEEMERNHLEALVEPSIKRTSSGGKLGIPNRLSITRSTSDNNIVTKSDSRGLLDRDGLLKVKSVSSDIEQTAALNRKQEAERQAQARVRYRLVVFNPKTFFSLSTQAHKHKHRIVMSSENERDASADTRKGKILILMLMLASRRFSRRNKHSYACACACVACENVERCTLVH